MSEYARGFVVFDGTLAYDRQAIDILFARGRKRGLDVYGSSQWFFSLRKWTIRETVVSAFCLSNS